MSKFVSLGEIMLRLKTPMHERFFQSPSLLSDLGRSLAWSIRRRRSPSSHPCESYHLLPESAARGTIGPDV